MTMLTLEEVSARVRKSVKAIRCQIDRGYFPATKIAGRVLIEEGELETYLRGCRKVTAESAVSKLRALATGRKAA